MGTYNVVSLILNVVSPAIFDVTQNLVQLNSRWVLRLINGISNDLQKLLKHFRETAIFKFLNTPLSS